MSGRRRSGTRTGGPGGVFEGFRRSLRHVERAKESLVAAAPTGRPAAVSLAEALAGFEAGLEAARAELPSWRTRSTEEVWQRCRSGLDAAARRAERVRLEASPEGYDQLIEVIDDLLDPLDAFAEGLERLRRGAG